jgi:hypothetical protein
VQQEQPLEAKRMSSHDQPPVAKYVADVSAFRAQKDEFFGTSPQSPIPHELRHAGFSGLNTIRLTSPIVLRRC